MKQIVVVCCFRIDFCLFVCSRLLRAILNWVTFTYSFTASNRQIDTVLERYDGQLA